MSPWSQDVEAVISEYDTDVGSKESEYQAALAEYNEVRQDRGGREGGRVLQGRDRDRKGAGKRYCVEERWGVPGRLSTAGEQGVSRCEPAT
jgi:hypothetical protein